MSPFLYSIQKIEMGTYSHFFRTRTRYLIFSMGNLSNLVHIRFFKDYMNIMSICKLTTWNWIEKFDTYLKLQSLKKVHLYYYFYYLQFLFFILKMLYCKHCTTLYILLGVSNEKYKFKMTTVIYHLRCAIIFLRKKNGLELFSIW